MPRPRTTSDEEILAATARVIARVGPRFTLANVAREISLAPATLIQRFGSKRGLMLALTSGTAEGSADQYEMIRQASASPLAALFAIGECMAGMAPTPEELANHLAFLQIDLTDPEFHKLALAQAKAAQKETRKLIDEAIEAGELVQTDSNRLAIAIQAMIGGSLLGWAIVRDGTAARAIRRDLETLVGPYRAAARSPAVGASRGPAVGATRGPAVGATRAGGKTRGGRRSK